MRSLPSRRGLDNLHRVRTGQPVLNRVDPAQGY